MASRAQVSLQIHKAGAEATWHVGERITITNTVRLHSNLCLLTTGFLLYYVLILITIYRMKVQAVEEMQELYHHKPRRLQVRDLMRLTWTTKKRWFPSVTHDRKRASRDIQRERPYMWTENLLRYIVLSTPSVQCPLQIHPFAISKDLRCPDHRPPITIHHNVIDWTNKKDQST